MPSWAVFFDGEWLKGGKPAKSGADAEGGRGRPETSLSRTQETTSFATKKAAAKPCCVLLFGRAHQRDNMQR